MTVKPNRRFKALAMVAMTIGIVSACNSATTTPSASIPSGGTPNPTSVPSTGVVHQPVTISVASLRPGSTQEAFDAFNLQVSQFQAKYPWITIDGQEYNWTGPTFAAALAAGTLPMVFTIPFTDGKGLIQQHQIVDLTSRVNALPYVSKFNPNVLTNGQDDAKKIYGIPTQAYGMSLTYNRTLFAQAGLNPDKPPTTWAEIRAAAKTISEKVKGVSGFSQMAIHNTGGWQLTTLTYALGGRMEATDKDGKTTATVNNDATKAALQMLKDMRWIDSSMGATFDYDWGSINQAFCAGKIGMFLGGSDLYTTMVQNNALVPADYGLAAVPLAPGVATAGLLGGGTLVTVRANTNEAQRDAAVNWIDFYYMQKLVTESGALLDANALKANNQPVGVPALPIFDQATYDQSQLWIKDLINVPTTQMTPFTSTIVKSPILVEPLKNTQALYALLDPVVQAVLTDKNANIDALLNAANKQVQSAIDKG